MTARRRLVRAVQKFGRVTVNRVAVALIRSGRSVPGGAGALLALHTVGRRSGRARTTPMGYVRSDPDTLRVVSESGTAADWFRNADRAGSAEVTVEGRRRRARLVPLEDEDPGALLRRMPRLVALANRALWNGPAVIRIDLGQAVDRDSVDRDSVDRDSVDPDDMDPDARD